MCTRAEVPNYEMADTSSVRWGTYAAVLEGARVQPRTENR